MQIVRTLFWVVLLVLLLVFTAFNWTTVEVKLWENMIVETKLPAIVIIAFLLGLLPAWLLHRGTKWRLTRRIGALENAARTNAANRPATTATPAQAVDTPPPSPANPVDPVKS
jgi:uncharacterized integral membrane protein